jgi:hypothetical protein
MRTRATKIIVNSMAAIVIAGFIAIIASSLRIAVQTSDNTGPTALAIGTDGKIYTNIATTLYVLDESGILQDSIPLASLGLQRATLTDILALPDGRLLIGSGDAQDIQACDLQQHRCAPFIQSGSRPVSAFKMAWDAQRRRVVVVDGERHRILAYDQEGVLSLESRGGQGGLKLPNTVHLTADDMAIIADTNQHRLVALDAQSLSRKLWEMPTSNESGKFRRVWPTDFTATADHRYWVILDNDLLKNGDVLLFDADGNPVRRLDLPTDWDPIKLRARQTDVLLAGYGSVDLVKISLDGNVIAPFGDTVFRGVLAETRARREASDRWWHLWIWVAIAPLVILAGIAAWLDTKISRLWKFSRWLVYGMTVLLIAPVIYIVWFTGLEKSAEAVALLLGGALAFMAILVAGLNTLSGGCLGVTRDQVVLGAAGKPQRHYYPRQLVYSSRFISSGDITVYLRTGKGPIYNPVEIRSHLEPLLTAARKLNPLQGYIYLLQQGDRLTWISTLGIACLAGLYLYTEFFLA